MAGYTRQSAAQIVSGEVISASPLNAELNQVLAAFNNSTGHAHDGTAAEGPPIDRIADADQKNAILIDTSNNHIEFYTEVSSTATQQVRIQDGAIVPITSNDIDLGTTSLQFKDFHLDGTAKIDTLTVDDNATVAGTLGVTGALTGTNVTASTAFLPDASDGASLGTSSLEFSDLFLADGAVINLGDDQDVTLTHVENTGVLLNSTNQLQFGDSGTYIHQSADGVLDLVSDTEIEINASTVDINGAVEISGNATVGGTLTSTGVITANSNVVVSSTNQLQFGDSGTYIHQSADGVLDLVSDSEVEINGTTIDINGAVDMSSTLAVTGAVTANAGVVVDNITIDGTEIDLSSGDLTVDVAGDIILDAGGDEVIFKDGSTNVGHVSMDSDNLTIKSLVSDKDMIFQGNDGGSGITALTLDMSGAGAATFNSTVTATGFSAGDGNITNVGDIAVDSISADDTDINIAVTDNSATAFTIKQGSDAYFIVDTANSSESVSIGTGISGTAVTIGHGTSEVTIGDNLTVTGNLTVSGTQTVVDTVTMNAENAVVFEGATADAHETTLTIIDPTADRTINLPNQSGTIPVLAAVSTTQITSTPEELNILDGVTSTATELNILDGVTSTTAELNILDGVTSTAAELNIMDGDTSASSTTIADADRVVVNDAGTMKQVAVTDLAAYFDDEITAMPNLVTTAATTVGALNSGSITSGFGTIDTGSSAITTTGAVNFGSLNDGSIGITAFVDEDNMSSNSATLVPTQQSVKAYVDSVAGTANNVTGLTATGAELNVLDGASAGTIVNSKGVIYSSGGKVNATSLQIAGTDLTATATEFNLLDGGSTVGTTAVASGDGILTNDNGTMRQTSLDTFDTYLSASTKTLTNKTLTAPKIADGGFIADANGNEGIVLQTASSAVNAVEITNAATGGSVVVGAMGDDSNIDIDITPKGTGEVNIAAGNLNYAGTAITSTGAEINKLDGYNGSVTELNYLKDLYDTGVTNTEYDYLDGVTSNIQTQLNSRASTGKAIAMAMVFG